MVPAGEDGLLGLLALVIFASVLFLLLIVLFFFFLARRRQWCLFAPPTPAVSSSSPSRLPVTKADLEKPLLSDDSGNVPGQISCSPRRNVAEDSRLQSDLNIIPPIAHDSPNRRRFPTGIYVLEEDLAFGQTLKRSEVANWPAEELKHQRIEEARNALEFFGDNVRHRISPIKDKSTHQRSSLSLEVISGPSTGLRCSRQSTNPSALPLTLGRISSSDVVLEDPGVSGKHALINWNKDTQKWELVDTGSMNGTLLNSQPVNNPDLGLRHWTMPVEIGDGDIITLGTSSKVIVQIVPYLEHFIPFKVGMASDPMALRRGGKNLPMEDVCYCQWPLPGVKQFGLFGIFDGHGGVGAAEAACEILPKVVSSSLSIPERREKVLSFCDASEVLKEAFSQTEAAMNHQYEGCTATALLVWADNRNEYFAQCANVGDSACVMNIGGIEIKMTEDHRISSLSERARFRERGQPLADGQGRLYGINLGRMLGDKFLKEQERCFSPEPYISRAVHIKRASTAFALLASDGLWDVTSIKKAVQIVLQAKATGSISEGNSAEDIANVVLNEARNLRTKDNTSIIFLDFDTL